MAKKKILFAYNAMNIGGSTTSLLSILNLLDTSRYDVDLILNQNSGDLFDKIPKSVHILPPARKYQNRRVEYFHRFISPRYLWHYFKSVYIIKKSGMSIHGAQYREWKDIDFQREPDEEYDVAIAFLEGDRCKYVARHVKAKRKIAWIHINYIDAKMDPLYDRDTMNQFDKIVLVSENCKKAFDSRFPELTDRTVIIENILSAEHIRRMAEEKIDLNVDSKRINLVTTCRISFDSKALDRAVRAFARLKEEQEKLNIKWYIIGDGRDYTALESLIESKNLQKHIFLLGAKMNPFPYLKPMNLFFLPSSWEGKPMSVTEGFLSGLPALVTAYSSSREQVRDGVDGMVVENSEEGIYQGLQFIAEHPEQIQSWKENVIRHDYSNLEEMKKIEALIDDE